MMRYVRQMTVPGVGPAGQGRIRNARLLVIGAGGLAAPVLQYLVGAGAGYIRLVDPDSVEPGNLHRQTLFREADTGRPKATVAAEAMAALNGECRIDAVVGALDPANARRLTDWIDIVVDCADSFAASYILSDIAWERGLPFVHASVVGQEGYCGGFCGGAPSLRAVFPDLPERLGSCAEDGVLGPVVGVIGSLQAQMALSLAAGLTSPLGRVVSFDAATWRMGGFSFDGVPEPPARAAFLAASEIRSSDFVVDLRAEDEAPLVRPGAHRLPVAAFGEGGPRPDHGQRAVLCCRSGQRAWSAAERLAAIWTGEIKLVALGDPKGETP